MRFVLFLPAILLSLTVYAEEFDIKAKYEAADRYRDYANDCRIADVTPHWLDGGKMFWYRTEEKEYVLVSSETTQKQPLFDRKKLHHLIADNLKDDSSKEWSPEQIELTDDAQKMAFKAKGVSFIYHRENGSLERGELPKRENPPPSSGGKISPDGKNEFFLRDHNVYLKDIETGNIQRLSHDGSPGNPYESHVAWSPDSSAFVCCRKTVVPQREVTVVESSPPDQLQPRLKTFVYAKPGDSLPVTRPVLFSLGKESREIEFAAPEQQYWVGDVKWKKDSSSFTFNYNKRGHSEFIVYTSDKKTGRTKPLIREKHDTFVHYTKLFRHDLEKRNEMIWISERDGWRHLYLIDSLSGEIKKQLTKGEWIVKHVLHVDEDRGHIRFAGCGKDEGEDPYLEKIYTVSLDGGEPLCLTPENSFHRTHFSPDGKYFIDHASRMDLAPTVTLRDGETGRILMTLEESDINKALEKGWRSPEIFCAKGRDGKTDIWGIIARPRNYDPDKKYPVIEYIYAGPHDSHVPKTFQMYFEGAHLTELGFIVVMIDGMGTSNRSKAFHDVCWKNLKDAGFPDRIAWMKSAASRYPEMDIERVGIYGMSAGGQNSMAAVLFHPDFYKVAVSSSACHDNRMDKIWWNELWMGYPIGPHYEENSNAVNAHRLRGRLLLLFGELDNNVDPASTNQVLNALIKANRTFEYYMIPGAGHTMGERFGELRRRDFFVRHLLNEPIPNWNEEV